MQRGRGGRRDDFFNMGDPFGGFGGFDDHRSLVSSFFGGRGPFDDPFFTRPLGSMFGPRMFGPSMFGPNSSSFGNVPTSGFIDNQPSQGPIIQEIDSEDDETEEKKENPRKHSRSSRESYEEERRIRPMQHRNETQQPQTRSFSFQSSSVTYGGANGAYYTSSRTRKMGNDGVVLEESKEADTSTGKAKHELSRGIRDKGHTVTRKLNPDGRVDTMQTLHNLNEEELPVFEETWKGNAAKYLPGWNEGFGEGPSNTPPSRGGWALPSAE